jgi:hypothetical protein
MSEVRIHGITRSRRGDNYPLIGFNSPFAADSENQLAALGADIADIGTVQLDTTRARVRQQVDDSPVSRRERQG